MTKEKLTLVYHICLAAVTAEERVTATFELDGERADNACYDALKDSCLFRDLTETELRSLVCDIARELTGEEQAQCFDHCRL